MDRSASYPRRVDVGSRCRGPRRPAPGLTTATECSSDVEHLQIRGGNSVERELWIWVNRQVPKWGYDHECSGQRRREFQPPNVCSKEVTGAAKHPRHLTAPRHFAADVSITRKSARRVERNIWVTLLGRRSGKRGAPTTVRARSRVPVATATPRIFCADVTQLDYDRSLVHGGADHVDRGHHQADLARFRCAARHRLGSTTSVQTIWSPRGE